ncbi:UPF0158 family protein [Aureivirga sp. CE67]|uniref:UPF0158 family protein n=1 Tax=Aureivirga sp. CE67 TaxID=1788983 RepID=UPI0018C96AC6|nr:UPF0158 family protein [Aureivirga sp. CE67]
MVLSKEKLKDIVGDLQIGMKCFLHKKTLELVCYPDNLDFDPSLKEYWQDAFNKLEAAPDAFVEIEKPTSSEEFKMMEEFTETIDDKNLQEELRRVLQRKSPFRNWKSIISDYQEFSERWYEFRDLKFREIIEEQLEFE